MKKIIASIILASLSFSMNVASADTLPIGKKYIEGCATLQNTAAFPQIKFIAAYYSYNLYEKTKKLTKIVSLDDAVCLHRELKGEIIELFAVEPEKYQQNIQHENYNPQEDINAYPLSAVKDSVTFDTSDELIDLIAKDTYFHRVYDIKGIDNNKRIFYITYSKNVTDINTTEVTENPSIPSNLDQELKIETPIFKDVPVDSVYAKAFIKLKREGLIQGYSDGTARPQNLINRAELMKIVMTDFDPMTWHDCSLQIFKDVSPKESNWYRNPVCLAYNEKIISGYPDKTFRPDQNIIFAEAAKIIVNVNDPPSHYMNSTRETTTPWYKEFTSLFEEINGIPSTIKSPDQKITRGEMALLMYNFAQHEL